MAVRASRAAERVAAQEAWRAESQRQRGKSTHVVFLTVSLQEGQTDFCFSQVLKQLWWNK